MEIFSGFPILFILSPAAAISYCCHEKLFRQTLIDQMRQTWNTVATRPTSCPMEGKEKGSVVGPQHKVMEKGRRGSDTIPREIWISWEARIYRAKRSIVPLYRDRYTLPALLHPFSHHPRHRVGRSSKHKTCLQNKKGRIIDLSIHCKLVTTLVIILLPCCRGYF